MLHAIVMAGGSGTRFWPASRTNLPKQLLPLAGPRTLLEDTVDRLAGLVPPERTLIVTAANPERAARLRFEAETILGACRKGFPAASRVKVRTGTNQTAPTGTG